MKKLNAKTEEKLLAELEEIRKEGDRALGELIARAQKVSEIMARRKAILEAVRQIRMPTAPPKPQKAGRSPTIVNGKEVGDEALS